jgi:hypothetical protein
MYSAMLSGEAQFVPSGIPLISRACIGRPIQFGTIVNIFIYLVILINDRKTAKYFWANRSMVVWSSSAG